MKSKVKVYITDEQDRIKPETGIRLLLRRCCNAVIELEGMTDNYEVSITFVDDEKIRKLNTEFRNIDSTTDVLSFPLGENGSWDINHDTGNYQLGDVVISLERAAEQAKAYGHSFRREIAYLTTHSVLHLLGYDHVNGGLEQVKMREKEEAVMAQIGLPEGTSYTLTEEMKQ